MELREVNGGDRLVLSGMQFFGHHGDVEAERVLGGRLDVDVELHKDLSVAGKSDRLEDTTDYASCFDLVREVVETRQYNLLEAVAENIADVLLRQAGIQSVRVRVAKRPPLRGVIRSCAIVIERPRPEVRR